MVLNKIVDLNRGEMTCWQHFIQTFYKHPPKPQRPVVTNSRPLASAVCLRYCDDVLYWPLSAVGDTLVASLSY
jgi:hypothetical protein